MTKEELKEELKRVEDGMNTWTERLIKEYSEGWKTRQQKRKELIKKIENYEQIQVQTLR